MKFWKHTLISAFAFFGISTTVLVTSCEQDSCIDLKCRNGGACVEGFCRCPAGYEGTECETQEATKFVGRFIGHYTCDNSPLVDTIDMWLHKAPSEVRFVNRLDITDTIAATVKGIELHVGSSTNDNFRRYTVGNLSNGSRLSLYSELVYLNSTTGEKVTCNFIGFK
ncbi:MAG TPA: hypothetical protein PL009_10735 [Flavipsychrobacter sp.]|nr:hypothetical protein [Flavipsychrobacter sp.]